MKTEPVFPLSVGAGLATPRGAESGQPVCVQTHGARIGIDGERLRIETPDGAKVMLRLAEISQVSVIGNVSVTTPCLHTLLRRSIPLAWHSGNGFLLGLAAQPGSNIEIRRAQYRAADDPVRALQLARRLVAAKIRNSRAGLRRRLGGWLDGVATHRLNRLAADAEQTDSLNKLRGIEGAAAAIYWKVYATKLRPPRRKDREAFRFEARRRRPPPDPVNAMLSYSYGMLVRNVAIALTSAGLDPDLGLYHVPAPGRPSLALDLMEPFRPMLADAIVATVINNGAVHGGDFGTSESSSREDAAKAMDSGGTHENEPPVAEAGTAGVRLSSKARRALVEALERRMDGTVRPRWLGFEITMRRLLAMEARLLAQWFAGQREDLPFHVPR